MSTYFTCFCDLCYADGMLSTEKHSCYISSLDYVLTVNICVIRANSGLNSSFTLCKFAHEFLGCCCCQEDIECIPVGCIPPTYWPYPVVLSLPNSPGCKLPWMQTSSGCGPPGCRPLVMWHVMHAEKPTPASPPNRRNDTCLWKYHLAPILHLWAVMIDLLNI